MMITKEDFNFNNGTALWKGVEIRNLTRDQLHQAFNELGKLYIDLLTKEK